MLTRSTRTIDCSGVPIDGGSRPKHLHDAMLVVSGRLESNRTAAGLHCRLDDPANFNPASTGIVETNLKLPEDWKDASRDFPASAACRSV